MTILISVIFLCSPVFHVSAAPIGTITLSLEAEVKEININQSSAPLVINGSIGYDGYSIKGVTITLDSACDVGEVTLTQYEFVFHFPDVIPFKAFIFIYPQTENDTTGMLTLNTRITEGGISSNVGGVAQIFLVLNYDENEVLIQEYKPETKENYLLPIIIIGYLTTSIAFVAIVSRRSDKSCKKQI